MATHNPQTATKTNQIQSKLAAAIRTGSFYGSIVGPIPMLFLLMTGAGDNTMILFVGLIVLQSIMLRVGHNHEP